MCPRQRTAISRLPEGSSTGEGAVAAVNSGRMVPPRCGVLGGLCFVRAAVLSGLAFYGTGVIMYQSSSVLSLWEVVRLGAGRIEMSTQETFCGVLAEKILTAW